MPISHVNQQPHFHQSQPSGFVGGMNYRFEELRRHSSPSKMNSNATRTVTNNHRIISGENLGIIIPSTARDGNFREITGTEDDVDELDGDEPGTLPLDDALLQAHSTPHTVTTTPRYPRYEDEEVRQRTFVSWRNAFPDKTQLINSGFFYLGGTDSVQCFQCGIILHSWEPEDTPDGEHQKHNPRCSFIQKKLLGDRGPPQPVGQNHVMGASLPGRPSPASNVPRIPSVDSNRAMKNVARYGHDESFIMKAFEQLSLSGETDITTKKLLDAVQTLEGLERTEAKVVVPDNESHEDSAEAECQVMSHSLDDKGANSGAAPLAASDRLKQLEKENENLRQQTLCRVCDDRLATELFLPCGHLACCDQCTDKLEFCPFCRKKIERTYHVFMP